MAFVPTYPHLIPSTSSHPPCSTITPTSTTSSFFGVKPCTRCYNNNTPKSQSPKSLPPRTITTTTTTTTTITATASSSFPSSQPHNVQSNAYMRKIGALAIKDYLTCRSIRTLLYYFDEFHDTPSKKFLLNFDHFIDREKSLFHNGQQFLLNLMMTPKQNCCINLGHPKGYFRKKISFVIDPRTIGIRILKIRQQLAEEWIIDLGCVRNENLILRKCMFEKSLGLDDNNEHGRISCENFEKRNFSAWDAGTFEYKTPLRYRSYQAIKVLTTQHAVARLMTHLRDSCNHEYMWLLGFIRSYGAIRDDDNFIKGIMNAEIQVKKNPDFTIVPSQLAMEIMELRIVVAEEWKMELENVNEDHVALQRKVLELSMGNSRENNAVGVESESGNPSSSSSSSSSPGSSTGFDPGNN